MSKYIESRHELSIKRQLVDIRPASEQIAEWLSKPLHLIAATVPAALIAIFFPILAPVIFLAIGIAVFAHIVNRPTLPFRYPKGMIDPKTGKEGEGILFFGNIESDSPYEAFKEVWLSDDDLRKHMVILGSTGSGKSETLKSIFFNALAWSSGFFIADGKADNKLPVDVYSMVRANGRDQDLLVLNFLMAGKTPEQIRLSRRRRSNSLNPFSSADPDTIIQMGANLLPKVEGDAKNWQEKALNLWRALVTALCYLRDTRGRDLSISDFIEYLALHKIEELYLLGYQESQERNGEWSYGFVGIKNYLESGGCPGYQVHKLLKKHGHMQDDDGTRMGGMSRPASKSNEQDAHTYEQHSFRTTQLMPALNLLDKSYGYIFRRKYPEIDMTDVALRNRVLVMLIPSLEKSAQEAESLGKLTIACLRVMMSKNLGSEVEGSYQRLILDKATESPYPYVAALDELAYYFSDGIAVMFAQARSLGMCMIAAAQDLEKLTEGNRSAEAGAMIANTASKFFMRNDDQNKTPEMVQKIVGKAMVAVKRSYRKGLVGYSREAEVEIREEDRITLKQMQAFKAGQGIFNQGGASRIVKSFFMGDDLNKHRPKEFHVNRFLQVAPLSPEEVVARSIPVSGLNDPYYKGEELVRKLKQRVSVEWYFRDNPLITEVALAASRLNEHLPPQERAIALYMAARRAILAGRENDLAQQSSAVVSASDMDLPPQEATAPSSLIGDVQSDAQHPFPKADAQDESDLDSLAFLRPIPFERKPADAILRQDVEAEDIAVEAAARSLPDAIGRATMDPLEVLQASGKTLNMSTPKKELSEILRSTRFGFDEASSIDFAGGDEWIQQGLDSASRMLEMPRSSDNTVVGLTEATLDRIARAEDVLGSPNPKKAAKQLERVVSVHVTPETIPTKEIEPDDIDAFFQTLQDSVSGKA